MAASSNPLHPTPGLKGLLLVVLLLVLLAAGISYARPPTYGAVREQFNSSIPMRVMLPPRPPVVPLNRHTRSEVGMAAGTLSCIDVPTSLRGGDRQADKDRTCTALCRRDGRISNGAVEEARTGVVTCSCCDPGTRVRLAKALPGSRPCHGGSTFGMAHDMRHPRTMYVNNGCKGIFRWEDGKLVRCESDSLGDQQLCKYNDTSLSLIEQDLARKQAEDDLRSLQKRLLDEEQERKNRVISHHTSVADQAMQTVATNSRDMQEYDRMANRATGSW